MISYLYARGMVILYLYTVILFKLEDSDIVFLHTRGIVI